MKFGIENVKNSSPPVIKSSSLSGPVLQIKKLP